MIGLRALTENAARSLHRDGLAAVTGRPGPGASPPKARPGALAWGLANIDTPEIIAFTAQSNLRSQAVMQRIGMVRTPERDFLHPALAEDHPLRPHVVFVATRP